MPLFFTPFQFWERYLSAALRDNYSPWWRAARFSFLPGVAFYQFVISLRLGRGSSFTPVCFIPISRVYL